MSNKQGRPVKFLLIGRTASGKSSIAKEVCRHLGLKQVISYTTRPMRKTEANGADHIFILETDVNQYKDDIAAYTVINGYQYFTTFDVIDKADIYVIDPNGVDSLKLKCGNRYKFIEIYIFTPKRIAEQRAKQRGDAVSEFRERWDAENEQFKNYERHGTFQWHLINDGTLKESVQKVSRWIQQEMAENSSC